MQHPFGQPCIVQGASQCQCGCRALFTGFDDDATTGCKGGGKFARRRDRGKIPGRERGHRTDRLPLDQLLHTGAVGGHDAAVNPLGFFGKPFEILGGAQHFITAFSQGLALFKRHQRGNVLGTFAHQFRPALENTSALVGHRRAPGIEGRLRRGKRAIQIRRRRKRHTAQFLTCGGIHHAGRVAFASAYPFAVDEEVKRVIVAVHGCKLR
ncbi:hypothetical protein D3C72_1291350 [compost metagenome]